MIVPIVATVIDIGNVNAPWPENPININTTHEKLF